MRLRRASGSARVLGFALLLPLTALPTMLAAPARAQSAADKTTARELALEGIELFKKEKYADALDKLQRAQELFDAPIHLVYIARCQAKLGQYVEAAEAYRKLLRFKIEKDTPQAFKDAVADGKKELPEVEPKIARLRIDVVPTNIGGLKLEIDGVSVSAATVGVDRPSNPGKHRVKASATGYVIIEQTVELKPGEKKKIALTLESDGSGAALPPTEGGEGGKQGEGKPKDEGVKEKPEEPEPEGNLGFLIGVRLGVAVPTGQLTKDAAMKDYFGAGGGSELRAGVRFAKKYTGLVFGGVYGYQAGNNIEQVEGRGSSAKTVPTGTEAGAGFMIAERPGKMGFFGELDVLFIHRFESDRDLALSNDPNSDPTKDSALEKCSQKLKAFGSALRLTGGVQIPMARWLQLSPYAGIAAGNVTDFSVTDGCRKGENKGSGLTGTPWERGGEVGDKNQGTHFVITLGVGGDILIGKDTGK